MKIVLAMNVWTLLPLSILWVGCFIFSVCSVGSTHTTSRSSKKKPSTGIDTMTKTLNGKQRWCLCLMVPHWRQRNVGDCKWHNSQEKGRSILVSHSILLDLNHSLRSKRVCPRQPSHGILHEEQAWSIHAEGARVRGNHHVTNRELPHPLIMGFLIKEYPLSGSLPSDLSETCAVLESLSTHNLSTWCFCF